MIRSEHIWQKKQYAPFISVFVGDMRLELMVPPSHCFPPPLPPPCCCRHRPPPPPPPRPPR